MTLTYELLGIDTVPVDLSSCDVVVATVQDNEFDPVLELEFITDGVKLVPIFDHPVIVEPVSVSNPGLVGFCPHAADSNNINKKAVSITAHFILYLFPATQGFNPMLQLKENRSLPDVAVAKELVIPKIDGKTVFILLLFITFIKKN